MGFFDRLMGNNSQPQDPTKRGFTNTIRNESDDSFVMWQHPVTDFNTNTMLFVGANETALFIKGGKIVGKFDEATEDAIYLKTLNFPGLRSIAELFNAGQSQHPCRVVFIRRNLSLNPVEYGWRIGPKVRDSFNGCLKNLAGNVSYLFKIADPEALYEQAGKTNATRLELQPILERKVNPQILGTLSDMMQWRGRKSEDWVKFILKQQPQECNEYIVERINEDKTLKMFGVKLVDLSVHYIALNTEGLDEDIIAKNKAIVDLEIRLGQGEYWEEIKNKGILEFVAKNPASQANTMLSTIMGVDASKILFPMGGGVSQPWDSPLGFGDSMNPINSGQNTTKPVGFVAQEEEMVKEQMETLREKMKMYKSDLEIGIITQTDYDELIEEIRKEYKILQKR